MCKAIYNNEFLDSEIQRVNADGTVRLFIYNVGFIDEARVIHGNQGIDTEAQAKEVQKEED